MRGLEPSAGGELVTPVPGPAPTLTLVPRIEPAEDLDDGWESLSDGAVAVMCTGSMVRVRGEVDRSNARLLLEALCVVARAGDEVTVDLAGLSFIDLGGFARSSTSRRCCPGPAADAVVPSPPPPPHP